MDRLPIEKSKGPWKKGKKSYEKEYENQEKNYKPTHQEKLKAEILKQQPKRILSDLAKNSEVNGFNFKSIQETGSGNDKQTHIWFSNSNIESEWKNAPDSMDSHFSSKAENMLKPIKEIFEKKYGYDNVYSQTGADGECAITIRGVI